MIPLFGILVWFGFAGCLLFPVASGFWLCFNLWNFCFGLICCRGFGFALVGGMLMFGVLAYMGLYLMSF